MFSFNCEGVLLTVRVGVLLTVCVGVLLTVCEVSFNCVCFLLTVWMFF